MKVGCPETAGFSTAKARWDCAFSGRSDRLWQGLELVLEGEFRDAAAQFLRGGAEAGVGVDGGVGQ